MRFLITGASGFIGYRLSLKLAEHFGRENVQLMVPNIDHHDKEKERHHKLINLGGRVSTGCPRTMWNRLMPRRGVAIFFPI
jgi:nucleoside-diphosphate-sugar epimerase